MKILFIETRKKFSDSDVELSLLDNLPGKKISLAATVQYLSLLPKIKKYLESKGKKVIIKKGAHYQGHVLGCNSSALDKNADTLLIITDGKFHAINNAIQLQKEIYVFNGKVLEKVDQKEIDTCNKKIESKRKRFLSEKNIGLLVSTKPGQKIKNIKPLKEKIKKLNKEVYIFQTNNINPLDFENFPQIKIWVNTACTGLARDDNRIINLRDILEFIS